MLLGVDFIYSFPFNIAKTEAVIVFPLFSREGALLAFSKENAFLSPFGFEGHEMFCCLEVSLFESVFGS